jgi:hypothetical protein
MYGKRIVLGIVLSLIVAGFCACDPVEVNFADAGIDAAEVSCDESACGETPDSCCPAACNANNDIDCAAICGNGTLEPGERCDPLETCPSECPAQGCQLYALEQPGTCFAQCAPAGMQTACVNADGCCPSGCNANNDDDCQPACGNGAVESGETCDPLTSCPATCPQVGCQLRSLENGGTCTAACANGALQTACVNNDGCCPSGCNANNDNNCQPGCGNGVIEAGETCDPLNTCPSSCPAQGCQLRTLQNGGTCGAQCVNAGQQTACVNNDGCCPSGCNANNDNNCQPVCGNGAVEGNETCDPQAAPPNNCQCADEPYTCYGQTGSAAQCNVRCHQPVTRCDINGDGCCAFTGTGDCGNTNDTECPAPRWQTYEWPYTINYSSDCFYPRIYGIEPGGSYMFTMCYPPGDPAPGGDPVINAISDNLGNVYNVTNDNCADTTALPYTANWRCENDQGQIRMFCASPSPGGFMIRSSNVSYLELRICPRSSTTGGRGAMHIWYNANRAPTPG